LQIKGRIPGSSFVRRYSLDKGTKVNKTVSFLKGARDNKTGFPKGIKDKKTVTEMSTIQPLQQALLVKNIQCLTW